MHKYKNIDKPYICWLPISLNMGNGQIQICTNLTNMDVDN